MNCGAAANLAPDKGSRSDVATGPRYAQSRNALLDVACCRHFFDRQGLCFGQSLVNSLLPGQRG